jgi:hypothetical protein
LDATHSLDSWKRLLDELNQAGASVVVICEMTDGTTSLSPLSTGATAFGKKRARSVQFVVRNGSAWRVALENIDENAAETASLEDRKALIRSVFQEVSEVIVWRAKDTITALNFSDPLHCAGLVDPQIALWLLDTDEVTSWDNAVRKHDIPKSERSYRQLEMMWRSVKRLLEANDLLAAFVTQEMPCMLRKNKKCCGL